MPPGRSLQSSATSDSTTVYSITTGYIPTLGFNAGDFKVEQSAGTFRPEVGRYDGVSRVVGNVVGPDGSLRRTRIRGSIAWYEYSTTVRAIANELFAEQGLQDQLGRMARKWYGTDKDRLNKGLLDELGPQISNRWGPGYEEGRYSQPGGTGEYGMGKKGSTPEEQLDQNVDAYKPDDAALRASGGLIGRANAIDIYMRDRVTGNYYRFDVTAIPVTEGGHHGLGEAFTDTQWGADMEHLLETGQHGQLQSNLLSFFQETQNQNWNPIIRRMVDVVAREGSASASGMIDDLRSGQSTLAETTTGLRDLLIELRGGFATDGTSFTNQQTGDVGAGARHMGQAKRGSRSAANRMIRSISDTSSQNMSQQAFQSALTFALHMFGNIIQIFASDSARQGGYSTGYALGGGEAGANFTVEVKHMIHASGESVLEFVDLKKGDVILWEYASLSEAYKRELFWDGAQTNAAIPISEARQLNLDHLSSQVAGDMVAVEVNTIVYSAYDDTNPQVVHSGASVIAPEDLNTDIDIFIQNLSAPAGGLAAAHRLLKPHLKNLSDMFDDPNDPNSLEGLWRNRVEWEQTDPQGWLNPNRPSGAAPGWTEMMIGEWGNPTTSNIQSSGPRGKYGRMGYDSFSQAHQARMMGQSGASWKAIMFNMFGKKGRGYSKEIPDTELGGTTSRQTEYIMGDMSQSAFQFDLMNNVRAQRRIDPFMYAQSNPNQQQDPNTIVSAAGNPNVKYWGLQQYMNSRERNNFNETVTPQFWAAPYIGILYPSGQVRAG